MGPSDPWAKSKAAFEKYMAECAKPNNELAIEVAFRAWRKASSEARAVSPKGPPSLGRSG